MHVLQEFKSYMRIFHSAEDDNLTYILETAEQTIDELVGGPSASEDTRKKALVFNRARYDYNGALEYFDSNFQHEIRNLSMKYLEVPDDV